MLQEFAWKLHSPSSPRYPVDSCLLFREPLPAEFIEDIEIVAERSDLVAS